MIFFFKKIKKIYDPDVIFYEPTVQNEELKNKLFLKDKIELSSCEINAFFLIRCTFSINIYVLIISYGLRIAYYYSFLKFYNPKAFITFIDNDIRFYILKKFFPKIKFISVQNGTRGYLHDFFGSPILKKKKKLIVDYLFVFNDYIKQHYAKYIDGNIITCGSFKNNNLSLLDNKKKEDDVAFISQYRVQNENYIYHYKKKIIKWKEYFSDEKIILNSLYKLAQLKKINLYIIGCSLKNLQKEKKYYLKNYPNIKFKFIERSADNIYSSYEACNKFRLITTLNSTLGYESLSRLNKTFFLMNINKKLEKFIDTKCYTFGWPKKFPLNGFCHLSKFNTMSLFYYLKKKYEIDENTWKVQARIFANKLLPYYKNNYKMISIIQQIIYKSKNVKK